MMPPIPSAQLEALAQRFVRFADQECGDYPSATYRAVVPPGDPMPAFRAFCRDYRDALLDLVSTGLVQTNEPRRCTFLLPAFATVARLAGGRPLALIEVGASAGLNLLFDRYGYDYGAGRCAGDPSAPVRFTCALHGAMLPPIHTGLPQVTTRVGIDLHPIQANDPQAMRWLRALVWPEHPERAARLQQVLAVAQRESPTLVAGDALIILPQAVAAAPADAALCVFHTATLAHFPPAARERFRTLIAELAGQRDLFWLSSEGVGLGERRQRGEYVTILTAFQRGRRAERQLAYNHHTVPGWNGWIAGTTPKVGEHQTQMGPGRVHGRPRLRRKKAP